MNTPRDRERAEGDEREDMNWREYWRYFLLGVAIGAVAYLILWVVA